MRRLPAIQTYPIPDWQIAISLPIPGPETVSQETVFMSISLIAPGNEFKVQGLLAAFENAELFVIYGCFNPL